MGHFARIYTVKPMVMGLIKGHRSADLFCKNAVMLPGLDDKDF